MNLFSLMGLVSTIALGIPVIILLISRLAWYKSFAFLLIYYILILSYNLIVLNYVSANKEFIFYWGTASNLLDAPLILLFMTYFSQTALFRKRLISFVFLFIIYEIVVLAVWGFTIKATTIILAPGLLIIVLLSVIFFVHQVKIAVVHQKAIGKAIMIASLLSAYAGYAFVYAVYYLIETPYKNDAQLIFYLITIVSSIPMAIGIFFDKKRVKHLAELKTTREELKAIYGEKEAAPSAASASIDSIVFKLDKNKQWS